MLNYQEMLNKSLDPWLLLMPLYQMNNQFKLHTNDTATRRPTGKIDLSSDQQYIHVYNGCSLPSNYIVITIKKFTTITIQPARLETKINKQNIYYEFKLSGLQATRLCTALIYVYPNGYKKHYIYGKRQKWFGQDQREP